MTIRGTAVQQLSHCWAMVLVALAKHYRSYGVDEFAHLCNLTPEITNEH